MKNAQVLVTGGAGYIGSHMAKMLHQAGVRVVVLDDLSRGHREALRYGEACIGGTGDRELLDSLFSRHSFDAVLHFAAFIEVGESVAAPAAYYHNNVMNAQVLLDAMLQYQVQNLVFSSTAAVFGEPVSIPINETHPKAPVNPYGRSKAMVEQILEDYQAAYGLQWVSLRYFNAAGADPQGELGERHHPETHLIPLVLQAASGRRSGISVFGNDYDTGDGSCIRDYIHVYDLCQAHMLALERLLGGRGGGCYNLGNGQGFSVRQVIEAAGRVTRRNIPAEDNPRRPGDPARLVADSTLAREELGWHPRRSDLETIIEDAWRWERDILCNIPG
ncbi:UDP-glucose 4-epimerase GalE [Desulfonatronospira sp.]|uniref:UDP-glucose 4-epimerase GalE n=1 Tax=Desulfonatronospira sp. TaxID=1962951 RepID=UPI0025C3333F|nr:UDP-glucose 4-epimerase GalE [Desulfonatronospira sp.]